MTFKLLLEFHLSFSHVCCECKSTAAGKYEWKRSKRDVTNAKHSNTVIKDRKIDNFCLNFFFYKKILPGKQVLQPFHNWFSIMYIFNYIGYYIGHYMKVLSIKKSDIDRFIVCTMMVALLGWSVCIFDDRIGGCIWWQKKITISMTVYVHFSNSIQLQ